MNIQSTGKRTAIAMAVMAGFVLASECAQAQPICGLRAEIVETLTSKWGEQRRATALTTPNEMIEVFVSPRTGTWTILSTTAGGQTCAVAAGDQWTEQPIGEPT